MNLELFRQIFEKSSIIKFNENPPGGGGGGEFLDTARQTDGQQLGSQQCIFTNLRAHIKTGYIVQIFARNSEKKSRNSRRNFRRTILVHMECKLYPVIREVMSDVIHEIDIT